MNEKHEWYGLNPAEREVLVLDLLKQGYNADMINEYFNVKTNRVIPDFMYTRGYSKRNNTYMTKQQAEQKTSEINPAIKDKIERLEEEKKALLEKQEELLNSLNSYKEKESKQLEQNNKMLDIIKDYQEKEKETQNQLVTLINNDKQQSDRVLSIIEYYMAQTMELKNAAQASLTTSESSLTETESKKEESYIEVIDTSLPIPETLPDDKVDRKTFRVNYRIYDDFMNLAREKYPEYKQKDLMSLAFQMFIDKYK